VVEKIPTRTVDKRRHARRMQRSLRRGMCGESRGRKDSDKQRRRSRE